MPSRLRRRAPLVLTALVAVAIAVPATAFGIHQFTDVPDSNPFHADIDALADAGVTSGCGTGTYCPKDFVTREQMAAFMNRLGALAPNKTPVVNADKLDGLDSSAFVAAAGQTLLSYGGVGFQPTLHATQMSLTRYVSKLTITRSIGGYEDVVLAPAVPTALFGKRQRLDAVEFCYKASADVYVDAVTIAGTSDATGNYQVLFFDITNRTDTTCRLYTLPAPLVMSRGDAISISVSLFWTVSGSTIDIGRTTFVLTPTAEDAPPVEAAATP